MQGHANHRNQAVAPLSTLQERFAELVMCDYTPRRPSDIPATQWVSAQQLFCLFASKLELRQLGSSNLKQLIIKWFRDHPAFAGLATDTWCKRLKNNDEQSGPDSHVFKFCFEHTRQDYSSVPSPSATAGQQPQPLPNVGTTPLQPLPPLPPLPPSLPSLSLPPLTPMMAEATPVASTAVPSLHTLTLVDKAVYVRSQLGLDEGMTLPQQDSNLSIHPSFPSPSIQRTFIYPLFFRGRQPLRRRCWAPPSAASR